MKGAIFSWGLFVIFLAIWGQRMPEGARWGLNPGLSDPSLIPLPLGDGNPLLRFKESTLHLQQLAYIERSIT